MERMNELIVEHVVVRTLKEIAPRPSLSVCGMVVGLAGGKTLPVPFPAMVMVAVVVGRCSWQFPSGFGAGWLAGSFDRRGDYPEERSAGAVHLRPQHVPTGSAFADGRVPLVRRCWKCVLLIDQGVLEVVS